MKSGFGTLIDYVNVNFCEKDSFFEEITYLHNQRLLWQSDWGDVQVRTRDSQIPFRSSFPLHYDSYYMFEDRIYKYKKYYCSKTWLSHFRRARRSVFDDILGLYQTEVNFYQHTLSTSRVLLCNSLGTPDLFKLSAIWIWRGPWNRKFSAPSRPSSKLENCVHPPKVALNLGFVRRKVFLRKGVRPAPVPSLCFGAFKPT